MRRRSLLIAVPAGLVTLAGCGDDDKSAQASPATARPPRLGLRVVRARRRRSSTGRCRRSPPGTKFGEKPTVAKGSGDPSKDLAVKTVIAGNGPTVAENDYIQANYLGQIWATAKVFDNSYDRKTPAAHPARPGQHHRRLALRPRGQEGRQPRRAGRARRPGATARRATRRRGIKGTDTLVFVVDISETFNAQELRQGQGRRPGRRDLPKVGTNTDGKAPSIDGPRRRTRPRSSSRTTSSRATGTRSAASDTLLVQYKGVLWDGGKEFDSTYSRGQLDVVPARSRSSRAGRRA